MPGVFDWANAMCIAGVRISDSQVGACSVSCSLFGFVRMSIHVVNLLDAVSESGSVVACAAFVHLSLNLWHRGLPSRPPTWTWSPMRSGRAGVRFPLHQ